MLGVPDIVELLKERWAIIDPTVHVLGTGLNSATWRIDMGQERLVMKAVPRTENLAVGLTVAEELSHRGFRSGPPVRAQDGSIIVEAKGMDIGLLRWEKGRPVDLRSLGELEAVGRTLARVHRLTHGFERPWELQRWPWETLREGSHLDLESWVRPTVTAVADEAESAVKGGKVDLGLVHGDPNRQEFLWAADPDDVALIDWGSFSEAPFLYDLASFHVLSHTTAEQLQTIVGTYVIDTPMRASELAYLPLFIRFRWAVQSAYFAWRLLHDVSTGGAGREFNTVGLQRSRAVLVQR